MRNPSVLCSKAQSKDVGDSQGKTELGSLDSSNGWDGEGVQDYIQCQWERKALDGLTVLYIDLSRSHSRSPVHLLPQCCILQWEILKDVFSHWQISQSPLQGTESNLSSLLIWQIHELWDLSMKHILDSFGGTKRILTQQFPFISTGTDPTHTNRGGSRKWEHEETIREVLADHHCRQFWVLVHRVLELPEDPEASAEGHLSVSSKFKGFKTLKHNYCTEEILSLFVFPFFRIHPLAIFSSI